MFHSSKSGRMGGLCEGLRDPSVSPSSPVPSSSHPTAVAVYPTVPAALWRLSTQLGLEVLRVVEAGWIAAAGLREGWDALSILEGVCYHH